MSKQVAFHSNVLDNMRIQGYQLSGDAISYLMENLPGTDVYICDEDVYLPRYRNNCNRVGKVACVNGKNIIVDLDDSIPSLTGETNLSVKCRANHKDRVITDILEIGVQIK